jgi:hypothetical protein
LSAEAKTEQVLLDAALGFVRENPFLAVGIAFGIGYFVGVYRGREIGEKISSAAAGYLMSEGNTLLDQLRNK